MRTRNSIRAFVRLSIRPSIRWSVGVHKSKCETAHFRPCPPVRNWYGRVSGLVALLPLPYLLRLSCCVSGFIVIFFFITFSLQCITSFAMSRASSWIPAFPCRQRFRRTKKVVCQLRRPYDFELDKMNEQETKETQKKRT